MSVRLKAWQLTLIGLALIGVAMGGLRYWRGRAVPVDDLVRRLPASAATIVYVDVAALRSVGLLSRLAGPAGGKDPDYLRFVDESGFDYQRDLRAAVIGLDGETTYLLGVGSFNWPALRSYAESRKGVCRLSVCRMPADAANRTTSWGALRDDTIALASSPDQWAAMTIMEDRPSQRSWIKTSDPVWLSTTGKGLRSLAALPDGVRTFTRSLESANEVLLTLGATAGGGMELRLAAECARPEEALRVASELTQGTDTLKKMLARENRQPNAGDLSGVLAGGSFQSEASRVIGRWPLARVFIDALTR